MNMIYSHAKPTKQVKLCCGLGDNYWTTILTFWVTWTVPGELTQPTFCVKTKTYHDFIVRTLNKPRTHSYTSHHLILMHHFKRDAS